MKSVILSTLDTVTLPRYEKLIRDAETGPAIARFRNAIAFDRRQTSDGAFMQQHTL